MSSSHHGAGKDLPTGHEEELAHVASPKVLLATFAALIFLTFVTVAVASGAPDVSPDSGYTASSVVSWPIGSGTPCMAPESMDQPSGNRLSVSGRGEDGMAPPRNGRSAALYQLGLRRYSHPTLGSYFVSIHAPEPRISLRTSNLPSASTGTSSDS